MSKSDFVLQSKVWDKNDHNRTGTVIGNTLKDPELVAIEWDDGTLSKVNIDLLLTEKDMSLELEFKAINAKLSEAARLLAEAASEADKHGKGLHEYDYDTDDLLFPAYNDLENAMEQAGWNTSSLRC